MEVKLSLKKHSFLSISNPETPLPSHCLKWWLDNRRSFRLHLIVLTKRWRFHVQKKSVARIFFKENLVDVTKRGKTLTSISKQCGVTIHSIAVADRKLLTIDHVFRGHLLYIPASSSADTQSLTYFAQHERPRGSLNILDRFRSRKQFIMQTTHGLPHAKFAGYFLLLVPLIAFCVRCIVAAFQTRVTEDLRRLGLNESRKHHNGTRSMRWKHALSDIKDSDLTDSGSSPESIGTSADQDKSSLEDMPHDYSKLESDYQKFLLECGISNCGYWRGGSPE